MCHMCESYGDPQIEKGLWYLNPKNYSRQMYKRRKPGEGFKGSEANPEAGAGLGPGPWLSAWEEGPEAYDDLMTKVANARREHGGQVVPLKDALKMMDLCSPIGLISCICRRGSRATDERDEDSYTCMGMGVGMLKWERWPERYKGGVAFVSPEGAKEWVTKMDKRGFVHTLMTFGIPYIGGFCQCDYPDCWAIRNRLDFGVGLMKGHHVAMVDYEQCNGCGVCAQRCQFGALKFEVTTHKANVDQFRCFGCGLCETGCPRKAISLLERMSLPALREVW